MEDIEVELAVEDNSLHSNTLEQLLTSILARESQDVKHIPLLYYLISCYQKLDKTCSKDQSFKNSKLASELDYLIVSYVGLILSFPAMLPQSDEIISAGSSILTPLLLDDPNLAEGKTIPPVLLQKLVNRFSQEPDILQEIFEPVLLGLVRIMQKEDLLGKYRVPLEAIESIMAMNPVTKTIIERQTIWMPEDCKPENVHTQTLLGGLFSLGIDSWQLNALHELIPDFEFLNPGQVESALYAVRTANELLVGQLHRFFYAFVKSARENREAFLKWLVWLAAINKDRLKMHADPTKITPDRIFIVAFLVLLRFCLPFMPPNLSKLDSIDPLFYVKYDRVEIKDATKNCATQAEFETYLENKKRQLDRIESPNFITECFYITVQYLRMSFVRMTGELVELLRNMREVQQMIEHMENNPGENTPLNALAIRNAKGQVQKMKKIKVAMEAYLLDPRLMEDTISFVILIIKVLSGILNKSSEDFRMLPEFCVECIGECLLFICRLKPDFWLNHSLEEPLTFMTQVLDQSNLIKNPYVRAKFVEFMFGLTVPQLESAFDSSPIVQKLLVSKLMHFYIEVESTGASSSFYDKFNIRYNISAIFKCLWEHPAHREQFIISSKDVDLFIRFTNLLLNDATYLLDEAIGKLAEIHERQLEQSSSTYSSLSAQERSERENSLRTLERQCESYNQLSIATLTTLEYLTTEIIEPFVRPELIDRLAAMLSFNILQLVGPKCTNLKVSRPEKYHWEPRRVLSLVVGILLNMSRKEIFLKALSRDTRSFSKEIFSKAGSVMQKYAIRSESDILRFERVIKRVADLVIQSSAQPEVQVPEEFLDPLMFTIMEDPVYLETSRVIVDRSTIVAHLLNDQTDPFNRMPLTLNQVKPQTDLKLRIEKFRREHCI